MNSDLKGMIDDVIFNIRVGIILEYQDKVLIEISKVGSNSVIPGGRIKAYETSLNAIKREIMEETGFNLDVNKIKYVKVLENLFEFDANKVHELFFVYRYQVSDSEYEYLNSLKGNKDNKNTYFEFVDKKDIDKVNLLPLVIIDIIRGLQ